MAEDSLRHEGMEGRQRREQYKAIAEAGGKGRGCPLAGQGPNRTIQRCHQQNSLHPHPRGSALTELETRFPICPLNLTRPGYSPLDAGWPRVGRAGPGRGGGRRGLAKDTGFLRVGHRGRGASNDVAIEGDLQGVAIGSVVQKPPEEATSGSCFHRIPVKGCAGLGKTKQGGENQDRAPAGYWHSSKSYNTSGSRLPPLKSGMLITHHRVFMGTDEINRTKRRHPTLDSDCHATNICGNLNGDG